MTQKTKIVNCIECGKKLSEENCKWCSMDCKEKTFIENFENSQWTFKLMAAVKKIEVAKVIRKNYDPDKTTIEIGALLRHFDISDKELFPEQFAKAFPEEQDGTKG